MLTPINFTQNGHEAQAPGVRRLSFNRALTIGAALALWAAILVGFKLLAI